MRQKQNSAARRKAEFTAWVTPHLQALHRTAWRFTGHPEDADDLVQELLLRIYQKPAAWAVLDNPATWLMRSLHNLFVDHWRRTRNKPLNNRRNLSWDDMLSSPDMENPGPEKLAHRQALQQRVHVLLLSLPRERRAILVMHDMEGYTAMELTVLLDLPLGTVKSRLFRARRELRDALLAHGNLPEEYYVLGGEMDAT